MLRNSNREHVYDHNDYLLAISEQGHHLLEYEKRVYRKSSYMNKSSSTGQFIFHLFAEFDRNLILEKSIAGRVAASARGRFGGRPEKFTTEDIDSIKMLVANGTPIKTIAEQ